MNTDINVCLGVSELTCTDPVALEFLVFCIVKNVDQTAFISFVNVPVIRIKKIELLIVRCD